MFDLEQDTLIHSVMKSLSLETVTDTYNNTDLLSTTLYQICKEQSAGLALESRFV